MDACIQPYACLCNITWLRLRVGVGLAHRTFCRAPVSTSHMETSLFPWVAEINQDCSWGCMISLLTRAPVNHTTTQLINTLIALYKGGSSPGAQGACPPFEI